MPTLPPELIYDILTEAASSSILDDPNERFNRLWVNALSDRASFLRSASLVARAWTRPAQCLLTSYLYLNMSRAADQMKLPEPISVKDLTFIPPLRSQDPHDAVLKVIQRLQGTRQLCVLHNEKKDEPILRYLTLPNLAGVTDLDIRNRGAPPTEQHHVGPLPFRLTRLSLRTPTTPALVDALIPAIRTTLTYLDISLLSRTEEDYDIFTAKAIVEAVAPQLLFLSISHYTNRLGEGIDLPGILLRCVKLQTLHLPFDRHHDPESRLHLDPLRAIPLTVRFLHLQDYFPLWAVTEWLSEGQSKVQHVEIAPPPSWIKPGSQWHLRGQEEELEKKCTDLGIKFSRSASGQRPF